jgi:hypothetical protein
MSPTERWQKSLLYAACVAAAWALVAGLIFGRWDFILPATVAGAVGLWKGINEEPGR